MGHYNRFFEITIFDYKLFIYTFIGFFHKFLFYFVQVGLIEKNETEIFTHGRGIYLTRQYMDQVVYNEKGNSVLIVKKK